MSKHRGQILEAVVRKWMEINEFSIRALSKKIGHNASTTYRHFEKEDLPYYIIRKYGQEMKHDFRVEFPEMNDEDIYTVPTGSETESRGYQPITLNQAIQQMETWKSKYYDLLEKHNELLRQKIEETS